MVDEMCRIPRLKTGGYRHCALAERKTAHKKWTHPFPRYFSPLGDCFPLLRMLESGQLVHPITIGGAIVFSKIV